MQFMKCRRIYETTLGVPKQRTVIIKYKQFGERTHAGIEDKEGGESLRHLPK